MTRTLSKPAASRALHQRNRLVEEHRDLVRPLALHYAQRCPEPLDDLQQVGMIGLIRAAELYQRNLGTPFPAFARPHIRGAILHHLRDVAPRVRLPRRQAERLERLLRHGAGGNGPGRAQTLNLPVEERAVLLRQRQMCRAMPLEGALLETLPAQESEQGGDNPRERSRTTAAARELLEGLEPRQRRVVSQVVLAGWSYRQLALELGISPMTVRRLLHQGLDALRRQLEQAEISSMELRHPAPSAAPGC